MNQNTTATSPNPPKTEESLELIGDESQSFFQQLINNWRQFSNHVLYQECPLQSLSIDKATSHDKTFTKIIWREFDVFILVLQKKWFSGLKIESMTTKTFLWIYL